jgi:hypothetical protein
MAYFVLFSVLAFWVLIDGLSRNLRGIAVVWAICSVLFGPIVVPIYLAKRPLKVGEVREGGTAWNLLKNFAVFWTIVMAVVSIGILNAAVKGTSNLDDEWARAGAGLGITVVIAALGAIWFFPTAGAAILGFFLKKNSLIETGPTGPMVNSESRRSALSGWVGIIGASVIAVIAIQVIGSTSNTSTAKQTADSTPATQSAPASVPSTNTSGWSFSEKKSEMDGTREVTLSLDAQDQIQGIVGASTPTLFIRCSKHKPEVFVNIGEPFQSNYGELEGTSVRIKFDAAAPIRQSWDESTNNEAAFAPNAGNLINHLLMAKVFRIEVTPFEKRETTITFNVGDLAERFHPIADECGISNKTARNLSASGSVETSVEQ